MRLLQAKRNEQRRRTATPTGKNNLFNPLSCHLIDHLASLIDAFCTGVSSKETKLFPCIFSLVFILYTFFACLLMVVVLVSLLRYLFFVLDDC